MSDNLVSLSEAARRLAEVGDKVDRSSLSRYVKQHAFDLKPVTRKGATVVDFERLVRHRAANSRVTDASPFAADIDFGLERAGKTRAERLRIELELGERQGVLTVVREVENAAHAAVAAMRAALTEASGDTAEAIAATCGADAHLVRPHVRTFAHRALEAFVQGLGKTRVIRAAETGQALDDEDPVGSGAG